MTIIHYVIYRRFLKDYIEKVYLIEHTGFIVLEKGIHVPNVLSSKLHVSPT